jgi:hypothetical protein
MKIKIAQRLCPFSHAPGTFCILPKTCLRFQIFPTRICVDDISGATPKQIFQIDLNLTGPAKDFTVQQDLERGLLKVWGHFHEGFVRYEIVPVQNDRSFDIRMEKCPNEGIEFKQLNRKIIAKDNVNFYRKEISSDILSFRQEEETERLSLGSHKAQDWDMIARRGDLIEILPFWHRLGRTVPFISFSESQGNLKLLESCDKAISDKNKVAIYDLFKNLFLAGFSGILSPQLADDLFQGFNMKPISKDFDGSSLVLLSEGAKQITRLFVDVSGGALQILPVLPPEFHSGRMINVKCGDFGIADLEWSKKTIRRLIFRSHFEGFLPLTFQKGIKSFRARFSMKDKGRRIEVGKPLEVIKGNTYFLDNFQK